MFEELLAAEPHAGARYDAWTIRIDGHQFGSGFVDVNPNSKIPALMDRSGPKPFRVFEVGRNPAAPGREGFGAFLPAAGAARAETLSWLMTEMGGAPYLGDGFGHFYAYAQTKIEYAIDRFAMEVKAPTSTWSTSPWPAGRVPGRRQSTRPPTWRSGPGTAARRAG